MTFLADESVDRQIVERLRLDGHNVAEMAPGITMTGLGQAMKASVVSSAIQER